MATLTERPNFITNFYRKRVFLDTAPLIYFIEGHSTYQDKLRECFSANDNDEFIFITSSITLLEVLVKPIKEKKPKLVSQYKNILLNADGIQIFEISNKIAERAAQLKSQYHLRTPDALQIATALIHGSDYFLTNDHRLSAVKEIKTATLLDF
ncbi:putative nucleic acid-binding protein [Mucilaginibacter oryzae]|uniref:Putative nucleic acid-binding protein n=1 Tax=Mucilaginibacter oryzae TaxID=468058 RepID=A0A316H4K8_9SPHI|nr:type II toxin-antitoxin system VapC family toxin [Mucilaginibacter oryzae]PWK75288.1 putative nucleic acid-binding protein [Mucilaginibacter oryzae]